MAFLISHEYYPWRTHLDWAFRKLAVSKTELSRCIDKLLASDNWDERLELIESIIEFYKSYITDNELLPEINLYCDNLENELRTPFYNTIISLNLGFANSWILRKHYPEHYSSRYTHKNDQYPDSFQQ